MKTKTIRLKMEIKEMIKFPSKVDNLKKVESFLNDLVPVYGINDDMYGNILVSLNEAVNNAITHGNQKNESKYVVVSSANRGKFISFQVSDEGSGFDYESVPDPTAAENLFNIRGRGVFIMKQLSDNIIFEREGSTVELQFNL